MPRQHGRCLLNVSVPPGPGPLEAALPPCDRSLRHYASYPDRAGVHRRGGADALITVTVPCRSPTYAQESGHDRAAGGGVSAHEVGELVDRQESPLAHVASSEVTWSARSRGALSMPPIPRRSCTRASMPPEAVQQTGSPGPGRRAGLAVKSGRRFISSTRGDVHPAQACDPPGSHPKIGSPWAGRGSGAPGGWVSPPPTHVAHRRRSARLDRPTKEICDRWSRHPRVGACSVLPVEQKRTSYRRGR